MSDPVRSLADLGLPAFLQEMGSVMIALLDENGRVLAANRGFLRLAPLPGPTDQPWDVRPLFINPRLDDIQALTPYHGGALLLYRGMLNIAWADRQRQSLQGHIYRWQQGRLLVAAEYDVEGLEMLGAAVMQLNDELTGTQRQLLRANQELKRNEEVILDLMHTDPLTGAGNRRRLDEVLATEVERCRRYEQALCVVMIDLDHFKTVNDRYGHAIGDEVLKQFAALLRGHARQTDLVARLNGEKFVVVLPATRLKNAVISAERTRRQLESHPLVEQIGQITASFGIAMLASGEAGEDLLQRADQALYRSKREGRNRLTQSIAPDQDAAPDVSSC